MKIKLFYSIDGITMDRGRQLVEHKGQVFSLEKTGYGFNLINITNAGLAGKECQKLVVWMMRDADNQMDWWNELLSPKREQLFTLLKDNSLGFEEAHAFWRPFVPESLMNFRYEAGKAVRYWPFHATSRIKPLKKHPKKWNLTAAIRAIVNGQFKDLKCTGIYTDDYRFDSSVNYRKGPIKNPVDFARKIHESPDGWGVSKQPDENGKLVIRCYHFNNNSFIPVIKS